MASRTSSKYCVLNLVTYFALHLLWVVAVSGIEVKVDYTSNVQPEGAMPDDVNVTVSTGTNTTAILRLSRVPHINLDFPLYTLNHDGTGTMVKRREKRATKMMTAFYQGKTTDAVFQITRNENRKNKTDLFKVKGEFKISGKSFLLKSEKRNERNFQTTTSSTTMRSTSTASSPSMSDSEDEIYSLEVQKVQGPTTDDFLEAHLDSQDQETKNETLSTNKPETDQMIDPSSDQSQILVDPNGSSGEPDLFGKLIRRRRSIPHIAVDVAAVVDYTLYIKFLAAAGNNRIAALQNIRKYFAFIFNGVDQRYQSINLDTAFNVYLSQVYVAESASTSPLPDSIILKNYQIDSGEALQAFSNFIVQRAKDVVTSYDHAMLFTAYDLTDAGNSAREGIAYNSTLCSTDGLSVSVIEETINFQSINLAAQQLGHSLSANNDGDGNNCSSSERYIMAKNRGLPETPSTMYNPWQFSRCSVDSFTWYLYEQLATSSGVTCLHGHPKMDNTIPEVSGRLLGQEIQPDQQCRAIYGAGSYFCRVEQKNWSDICHALSCLRTSDNLCYNITALDGTTCGNLKICRSGQCGPDPQAPTADESCMFGDQPGVVLQGMTCPQVINVFKGLCYGSAIQKGCCKSCRDVYLPLSGCEYGDRWRNCTAQMCTQNPADCCGSCNTGVPFTTKPVSVVTYAPLPSNQTHVSSDDVCRNREWNCYFLTSDKVTQCYDEGFNKSCCQFCQQHQTNISGCEYGDRSPQLCRDKSVCTSSETSCCQFCATPTTTTGYHSNVTTGFPSSLMMIFAMLCSMCLAF